MCQQDDGYKIFAQLVINGNDIPTTEELNRIFEYNGTGFNKGDHYSCRQGQVKLTRLYSAWSIDSEKVVKSYDIIDHLTFILRIFEPRIELLRSFLDSPDICVFIRIWVESDDCIARVTISSPMLIRLANICNEIYIVAIAGDETQGDTNLSNDCIDIDQTHENRDPKNA